MELKTEDRDVLLEAVRAATHKVEEAYRPARADMKPGEADMDPVLGALYEARDHLMNAERAIHAANRLTPSKAPANEA